MRKNLSDRTIKSLKPALAGKRYDVRDAQVPGLLVRVTDRGVRTFMLQARYPGSTQPTRRALGVYDAELSLEQARDKARAWRKLLKAGTDPQQAEEAQRRAIRRAAEDTFGAVAEAFLADVKRRGQRKAAEVERDLRREFIARWDRRPIASITPADVAAVIDAAVERDAPYQAHNLLSTVRRLFAWAIGRNAYGLDVSPCDRLKPRHLIGPKAVRTRVLSDDELRVFWRATGELGYPYGPLLRLLLVTMQRKSEVAEAVWPEFDLAQRLWFIPPARMKSDRAHVVPISEAAAAILEALPRFTRGAHLFSTRAGAKPVNGFSVAKARLDALMRAELPDMPPFVIHDLRRTGRTHLSALPVAPLVAELVIAHAKPGLLKIYDQHSYHEEKGAALALWDQRLQNICAGAK